MNPESLTAQAWERTGPLWRRLPEGGWLFVCDKAPTITHGWWARINGRDGHGQEYGEAGKTAADRWADSLSPETVATKALAAQWEALLEETP